MKKFAVQFYKNINNIENAPGDCIALVKELKSDDKCPVGWTMMWELELAQYKKSHEAEWNAWLKDWDRIKLLKILKDKIDARTDVLIANGFKYGSVIFKLDIEHQMTYKGAYDLRQFITYPYRLKGIGSNYIDISNEQEFTQFIISGFSYLQNTIKTGWDLKDSLDSMTYEELLKWCDPR